MSSTSAFHVNLDCNCCCKGTFSPNQFKKFLCTDCQHSFYTHKPLHLHSNCQCCLSNTFRPNPFKQTLCGDCQHAQIAHDPTPTQPTTSTDDKKPDRPVGKLGDRLKAFQ
ncbi:hypothetical protein RCL1_006756 [Eukaryota sp. TZLM3-RCL]